MKKTHQAIISIVSFIIISTFFVGTAQAQVCEGDYIIDGIDTNDDIETLSGCTEITGSLHIRETHLASLSELENITSVGGGLLIYNNTALTNLCGLYYAGDKLLIESVCMDVLKQLPGFERMRLADETTSIKARFRCEITVHQFVALKEMLLVLLPLPTSNNESICVQATLFDTKRSQVVKKYEEWGYNKQSRFFFIEGKDKPLLSELRPFLVKKVLTAVAKDTSTIMTRNANL
jgi:hypothetical protein